MQRAGIPAGEKLGRLKEWLYRIQIERNIRDESLLMIELARLPFSSTNYDDWPRISFP